VLAHHLGRGREVEEHFGAVERQLRRGGNGRPEVFADFDAEFRAVDLERETGAEVGLLSGDGDAFLLRDSGARREPAVFVKLRVVGDVGLGHDAEHASLREDYGAVVEGGAVAQGRADKQRQRQFARRPHDLFQRGVGRIEQGRLQQQVAAGVACYGEFGERDDFDAPPGGFLGQPDDARRVVFAVGDPHLRNGRRDFQKTEIIHPVVIENEKLRIKNQRLIRLRRSSARVSLDEMRAGFGTRPEVLQIIFNFSFLIFNSRIIRSTAARG